MRRLIRIPIFICKEIWVSIRIIAFFLYVLFGDLEISLKAFALFALTILSLLSIKVLYDVCCGHEYPIWVFMTALIVLGVDVLLLADAQATNEKAVE